MTIHLTSIFGCPSIGVYMVATDRILILPSSLTIRKAERLGKWLGVETIQTNIGGSFLIGSLVCANSNGLILPPITRDEEAAAIYEKWDRNVDIIESRYTAYGNMILANDKGAVVDPILKGKELRKIRDTLDVEIAHGTIVDMPYVGSLAVANNKGVLTHPMIKEEERTLIENVLKVPVSLGTVNRGIPYISTGLLGNVNGAITGYLTTGPELFIIGQALGVV